MSAARQRQNATAVEGVQESLVAVGRAAPRWMCAGADDRSMNSDPDLNW